VGPAAFTGLVGEAGGCFTDPGCFHRPGVVLDLANGFHSGWHQATGDLQQTSQHRLKVVLIHAQCDAPIEENGASEGLVEKKPLYVQLMKEGHSNSAACRILGIHLEHGPSLVAWTQRGGGPGAARLGSEASYAVPAAAVSSRYLSEDERIFIADRLLVRASLQSIARDLGRSPSTISRELARNRPDSRRYHPFRAQKMAQKRRPRPRLAKLAADDELRHYVVECLSKRWSPQQVCRALKERFPGEKARHLVHETVYRVRWPSTPRSPRRWEL
jgi:hypothetical protein